MGGGVEVIPKEICIRADRGDALGAGGNVCRRVLGGRGDDLLEESKDIKLDQMEVPATVEVVHDIEPGGQNLVIEDAPLSQESRSWKSR